MNDGEKLDRFLFGLKPNIRVEVLKSDPRSFDEAAHKALCIDSAMFSIRKFNNYSQKIFFSNRNYYSPSRPVHMEVGNIGTRASSNSNKDKFQQRRTDIQNNACFTCHKPGCRPYEHCVHEDKNWRKGEIQQMNGDHGSVKSQENYSPDGSNSGKDMFHLN